MSKPKKFSLKPIETQMLNTITEQMTTIMSNYCSTIAMERLAQQVTTNTRFSFNDDMTELTIEETETDEKG